MRSKSTQGNYFVVFALLLSSVSIHCGDSSMAPALPRSEEGSTQVDVETVIEDELRFISDINRAVLKLYETGLTGMGQHMMPPLLGQLRSLEGVLPKFKLHFDAFAPLFEQEWPWFEAAKRVDVLLKYAFADVFDGKEGMSSQEVKSLRTKGAQFLTYYRLVQKGEMHRLDSYYSKGMNILERMRHEVVAFKRYHSQRPFYRFGPIDEFNRILKGEPSQNELPTTIDDAIHQLQTKLRMFHDRTEMLELISRRYWIAMYSDWRRCATLEAFDMSKTDDSCEKRFLEEMPKRWALLNSIDFGAFDSAKLDILADLNRLLEGAHLWKGKISTDELSDLREEVFHIFRKFSGDILKMDLLKEYNRTRWDTGAKAFQVDYSFATESLKKLLDENFRLMDLKLSDLVSPYYSVLKKGLDLKMVKPLLLRDIPGVGRVTNRDLFDSKVLVGQSLASPSGDQELQWGDELKAMRYVCQRVLNTQ